MDFNALLKVAQKANIHTLEDVRSYFNKKNNRVGEYILRSDPRSNEKEAYVLSMQGHNGNIMHLKIKKNSEGRFAWSEEDEDISFNEAISKLKSFVENKKDKVGPNRHLVIGNPEFYKETLADEFKRQLAQTKKNAIRTSADVERYFKETKSELRQWTVREDPKRGESRAYILSMKGYNGKTTHLKIKESADGEFTWSGSTEAFSLEEMLAKLSVFTEQIKNKTGEAAHLVMGDKQKVVLAPKAPKSPSVKERIAMLKDAQQKKIDGKPEFSPREIDEKHREAKELGISSEKDLEFFFHKESNSGRLIVRKENDVFTLSMRCNDGRMVHMRLRENTHNSSKFAYGPGQNNASITFVEARSQLRDFKEVIEKTPNNNQKHFFYGGVKKKNQRHAPDASPVSVAMTKHTKEGRNLLFALKRKKPSPQPSDKHKPDSSTLRKK